jgi:hypothetical protein
VEIEYELLTTTFKAPERMSKQKAKEDSSSWMVKLAVFHEAFSDSIKFTRKIKNDLLLKQFCKEDAKKPIHKLRPTLLGKDVKGLQRLLG